MSMSRSGIAYNLVGPKDAPAVVLVHGIGLTRQIWDTFVPKLAERYRVLSYDLCGHGQSRLPAHAPTLASLSAQLCGLMDETGIDRAVIVGFSLGGMINRRLAMDYPDKVSALVILNSPHERDPEAQRLVEERAAASSAGGIAATLDATIERWFTADFRQRNPEEVAAVRKTVLANDVENFGRHRQVLATGVLELIRPMPPINRPALVMTCENDSGSTPEMTRAIAAEIPGARAMIIPDLQHLGLLEEPELFAGPILQFLSTVPGLHKTTLKRNMTCPS